MAQLAQDRSLNQLRNAQHMSSYPADWYIEDDETMPQSTKHDAHEARLRSIFVAWNVRTSRGLLVGCELAFRWDPKEPGVGIDPDIYVVEMPPPVPYDDIPSIRTWEEGNFPPILAIEVVSRTRPKKDYSRSPERHNLLGTFELWVFDPHLYGNAPNQPSVYLQIYQRETNNRLVQTYAGDGPYFSDATDAWVMVIDGELVIANDREGKDRWPTLEEAERQRADEYAKRANEQAKRAENEAKRANEQAKRADEQAKRADDALKHVAEQTRLVDEERAEKEFALARIAELEALLVRRST